MTKFSDFINGLGIHSELLTLESKMRDEISSRYESLVEKASKGNLKDLHPKAQEFFSSSLDFLSFKDDVVNAAVQVVHTCTLDNVSGVRYESWVPMNDLKAVLVYYCLDGFSCSEMKDFDGILPANGDEAVNWMMECNMTTGSISEFVFTVKWLRDKVLVWGSDYLGETPVHLDDGDIMLSTSSFEWFGFITYFVYFLTNLAMHLGTEKCCFEVITNSASEHFVYKYFMTHVIPDLGAYVVEVETRADDEFDEVLEDMGAEEEVFTKNTLTVSSDDWSDYFGDLVIETYVVMIGFNSRREALEYYNRPKRKGLGNDTFPEFMESLGAVETIKELYNSMRDEIKSIVDANYQDCNYLDLVRLSVLIVESCIQYGQGSSRYTAIWSNIHDTDAEYFSTCIPDFEFGGMTELDDVDDDGEIIHLTKTLWKYNPTDKNSAVKEYVEYLLSLKERVIEWLSGYFSKNPIECIEGTYTLTDENKVDWVHFLDYVSHVLLGLTVKGIYSNFYRIAPRTPYEKYALRYALNLFKEQLDIRVLYNDTYETEEVTAYTECFKDVRFSPVFENNYTKRVLNLSKSDTIDNSDESVESLRVFAGAGGDYIIVKGRYYEEPQDRRIIEFWGKKGYTQEL